MVITISEDKGNELLENTHDGVTRKLQSAKQLVNFERKLRLGPYAYALEEFGKFLLVGESKLPSNLFEINCDWFKLPKAHKYNSKSF